MRSSARWSPRSRVRRAPRRTRGACRQAARRPAPTPRRTSRPPSTQRPHRVGPTRSSSCRSVRADGLHDGRVLVQRGDRKCPDAHRCGIRADGPDVPGQLQQRPKPFHARADALWPGHRLGPPDQLAHRPARPGPEPDRRRLRRPCRRHDESVGDVRSVIAVRMTGGSFRSGLIGTPLSDNGEGVLANGGAALSDVSITSGGIGLTSAGTPDVTLTRAEITAPQGVVAAGGGVQLSDVAIDVVTEPDPPRSAVSCFRRVPAVRSRSAPGTSRSPATQRARTASTSRRASAAPPPQSR